MNLSKTSLTPLFVPLLLLLIMTVFHPVVAGAVQSRNPQLLYPSAQRIVIFVADG